MKQKKKTYWLFSRQHRRSIEHHQKMRQRIKSGKVRIRDLFKVSLELMNEAELYSVILQERIDQELEKLKEAWDLDFVCSKIDNSMVDDDFANNLITVKFTYVAEKSPEGIAFMATQDSVHENGLVMDGGEI